MKALSPNLMVQDVVQTIDFYTSILGFESLATVPDTAPYQWGMVRNGNATLMFQSQESFAEAFPGMNGKEPAATLNLYIDVENVDALYKEIKEQVVLVHKPAETFYNTKEFTIQDNNGYYLTFAQDLKA